jgi:hypothetical protein
MLTEQVVELPVLSTLPVFTVLQDPLVYGAAGDGDTCSALFGGRYIDWPMSFVKDIATVVPMEFVATSIW